MSWPVAMSFLNRYFSVTRDLDKMKKILLSLSCFLTDLSFSSAQTNLNLSPREPLIVSAARPDSARTNRPSLQNGRPFAPDAFHPG
jgi:hypothetical protein